MDNADKGARTVGEVERITGIPRRKIKYFIERGILRPSGKSEIGYWLYTEADIQRLRLVALCKELGWPDSFLRALPEGELPTAGELDRQISRLTRERELSENRLLAARFLKERLSHGGEPRLEDLLREVLTILEDGAPALEMLKQTT